jgi:hypothetical protein
MDPPEWAEFFYSGWEGRLQARTGDKGSWPGRGQSARFQIFVNLLGMNLAGEFDQRGL